MYESLLDIATEMIEEQAESVRGLDFPILKNIPSAVFLPGGVTGEISEAQKLDDARSSNICCRKWMLKPLPPSFGWR
jgi:hypothetical protein